MVCPKRHGRRAKLAGHSTQGRCVRQPGPVYRFRAYGFRFSGSLVCFCSELTGAILDCCGTAKANSGGDHIQTLPLLLPLPTPIPPSPSRPLPYHTYPAQPALPDLALPYPILLYPTRSPHIIAYHIISYQNIKGHNIVSRFKDLQASCVLA